MEPTLSVKYADLIGEVGVFLGYGRGAAFGDPAYTAQQQAFLDSCVKSGLRQFYYPPPLDGEAGSYDWSFMKPVGTLDLAAGAGVVALPDDFGGFEGPVTVLTSSQTSQPWRIEWRNEASIRQMYATTPQITGPPAFAAQQPLKGTTGTQGQRSQLVVFPLADREYTLQVQYYVNPDYLTGANPYTLGGTQHAETVVESCLAVAEQRMDDSATVHTQKFMQRLAASVSMDRRNKPQKLGLNRDDSDGYGSRCNPHDFQPACTYGGQTFT